MDDWLERYGRALDDELGNGGEEASSEWVEPEAAGADVAGWAQAPADAAPRPGVFSAAMDADVREALLELARLVAHSTERRNAPLATYLAGQFVALRVGEGAAPVAAAEQALAVAQSLLP